MAMPTLSRAGPGNLESLVQLEADCFPPDRRESSAVLRRALSSSREEVWMLGDHPLTGALWLRLHPRSMRIFSLAIRAADRGKGYGRYLLDHACERAAATGRQGVVLEVDASDAPLIGFYTRSGYLPVRTLPNFYGPGSAGLRMKKMLAISPALKPCR